MDLTRLGALERYKDPRDIMLGMVQAPVTIPDTFLPDNSWLVRNFQGSTYFCGEHAATHLQAILEHYNTPTINQRYTPRYGVVKLKDPKSPVYDGFAPGAGTTMTNIFKWLQKVGADSFEPLENDVTLPLATYCDPSVVTPTMDADAANNKISSYAFDALTFPDLCQVVYQNHAAILLIRCDSGFWGTSTPAFTTPKYDHFVVADGFSPAGLRVIDSAEPNPAFVVKTIAPRFVVPTFVAESGTAVDIPLSVKTVATSTILTAAQKMSIIQTILADIAQLIRLIQKEL
jgi:hypothetical protein